MCSWWFLHVFLQRNRNLEAGLGVGEEILGSIHAPNVRTYWSDRNWKNNIKQYSGEFKPYLLPPWYRNPGYKEEENTVTTDFTITIMVIAVMYQVGCGLWITSAYNQNLEVLCTSLHNIGRIDGLCLACLIEVLDVLTSFFGGTPSKANQVLTLLKHAETHCNWSMDKYWSFRNYIGLRLLEHGSEDTWNPLWEKGAVDFFPLKRTVISSSRMR